jgi:hypothetical protein
MTLAQLGGLIRLNKVLVVSCATISAILAYQSQSTGMVSESELATSLQKIGSDLHSDQFIVLNTACGTCVKIADALCDGSLNSSSTVVLVCDDPAKWRPRVSGRNVRVLGEADWDFCTPAIVTRKEMLVHCIDDPEEVGAYLK